ncbi:MAG: cytochrome C, partial [Rhodopirellula bahusiensis]
MADTSSPRVWLIAAVIAGLCLTAAYVATRSEDESELVEKLSRKMDVASSTLPRSQQKSDVVRLTPRVVAQKGVIPGSWVLQKDDQPRPRLVLPFSSLENGPSSSDGVQADVPESVNSDGFLGADACAACHQDRHRGFLLTAHNMTSSTADPDRFLGPVDSQDNELKSSDPDLTLTIQKEGDSIVQQVSLSDWSVDVPMDVITGS